MDKYFWSAFDKSSEDSAATTLNSTGVQPTTARFPARQSVSLHAVAIVGLVVVSIGTFANAMVLTVLIKARRQFGSSVHTLIVNQSAMDLWATVFGAFTSVVMFTHGFKYNGNRILHGAVCVLFEGAALTSLGMTAEKMGLIVITLERYFKIVHAIAHRKYYRDWMTKVGVALPWIGGTCLILIPGIGTTRVVNGRCLKMTVWPHEDMAFVSMHII